MSELLYPGRVLDGTYRLVAVIGRGGMGEVWRARHERLPKEVAVKVLLDADVSTETSLARFRREAEIASRLGHPNIVEVLDFNVLPEGLPYMVLELLSGQSLRERLRCGPLPLASVTRIVRQVGSALGAAHAAGIVHRDLKPENIFLVPEPGETGPTERAKVLDFGISKIQGSDTRLTQDSEVLGTPVYMAPEQATGRHGQVDGRADQFALACIAYEALSGKMAFSGHSLIEVLGRILEGSPEPLGALVPGLPEATVAAVRRALSKNPEDRFPTIAEFVAAFGGSDSAAMGASTDAGGGTDGRAALESGPTVAVPTPAVGTAPGASPGMALGPEMGGPTPAGAEAVALAATQASQGGVASMAAARAPADARTDAPADASLGGAGQAGGAPAAAASSRASPAARRRVLVAGGIGVAVLGSVVVLAFWLGRSTPRSGAPNPPGLGPARADADVRRAARGAADARVALPREAPMRSRATVSSPPRRPGIDAGPARGAPTARRLSRGRPLGPRRVSARALKRRRSAASRRPPARPGAVEPGDADDYRVRLRKARAAFAAGQDRQARWYAHASLRRRDNPGAWLILLKVACRRRELGRYNAVLPRLQGRWRRKGVAFCRRYLP